MISSVFKYAYPHAKIRAFKGRLLSNEHFRALLQAEAFDDVLHILQTTAYREVLSKYTQADLSVAVLTREIYRSLFEDYEKTIRSLSRDLQGFFIFLYQKYELINLKTILRGIVSHVEPQEIAQLLLPTEHYTLFSKETLLEYHDIHALIDHLQGTFFQYPLNRALRRFEEEQEFFPLEMALDLHYYHTLWDATEKLPERERQESQALLGMALDVLNVGWIIRFKEQYHLSPEEILNYTIQHGHAFTLEDRRSLARAQGAAEVLAYLKTTWYGKAFNGDEPLNTLHIALTRYMKKYVYKNFSGNPFHLGLIFGYLLLKEFEISDILTIAEAKKYAFSLEESQHYLIHLESE